MKRKLFFIVFFVLSVFGYSDISAQNSINNLKFNKLIHDFGTFDINDGKKSFTFTFKNSGSTPVVIQTVISSCGCTTPTWTKKPIMPGETGEIHITFLNDQGAFPFEKSLSVYITDIPKPVILRIRGIVKDKNFKITDSYPSGIGPLKMKSTKINAGMVSKGISKEFQIEVYNDSKKSIKVIPSNISKGLSIETEPAVLAAESTGILKVKLNPDLSSGWGKSNLWAMLKINDKTYTLPKLEFSCVIIDNFSTLTREQITNAPLPIATNSNIDFGSVKKGTLANVTFEIKNYGSSDFIIHKAESSSDLTVSYQTKTLPEKSSKISVKINTSKMKGKINEAVTLITNAPSRPQMNLIVEGIVN